MARIKLKYVNGFANRHRKGGRPRYYFRRRGCKAIPLPGLPGSEEFMAAYALALGTLPQSAEIGECRTLPGTVNSLIVAYYKSDEWLHGLTEDSARHAVATSSDSASNMAASGWRSCAAITLRGCSPISGD